MKMETLEELRKSMILDADMNTSDIEQRFKEIAKMLFEKFAIQKSETIYLFKDIEFYFYNKNHRDIITHPRVSKPLCWYVNDFGGIDLNFASSIRRESRQNCKGKNVLKYVLDDNAFFGGILIRQLVEKGNGEVLNGPWACAELFRSYDATGADLDKDLPLLVECDNEKVGNIPPKCRYNIISSKQNEMSKVNNILYQYHNDVQPSKETLYKDFADFKEKPYRYEKQ